MYFYHDSRDLEYRSPFGAVTKGTPIRIRVRSDASSITLRLWQSGIETLLLMEKSAGGWQSASFTAQNTGLIWYYFLADGQVYCAPQDKLGGNSVHYEKGELVSHQITVYENDFHPPRWMSSSNMYQIMVDRFYDGCEGELLKKRDDIIVHTDKNEPPYFDPPPKGEEDMNLNDFFGGNLEGIRQKLSYLKSLGIDVLYLNPIFAANSNHKYDTADYYRIDPTFGTGADFKRLCSQAKEMGMRIVLDGVFAHTGDDSVYFNKKGRFIGTGAYQSKDSPYYSWYHFENWPDKYRCWWDFKTLPRLNTQDPSFLDFMVRSTDAVCAHWLKNGSSGWRLDVADELPDSFLEALRERIKKEDEDACIIGEVWEDASNKVSYSNPRNYVFGKQLDSVMNYPLRDALIAFLMGNEDAQMLRRRILSLQENYPAPMFYSLMNLMGTHDRSRIINILGRCDDQSIPHELQRNVRMSSSQRQRGKDLVLKMLGAICALPGMPCVYYGDEIGMEGMRDPFCRGYYKWDDPDSDMRDEFTAILKNRQNSPVLKTGHLKMYVLSPDALAVVRWFDKGYDIFGEPQSDLTPNIFVINRAESAEFTLRHQGREYTVKG